MATESGRPVGPPDACAVRTRELAPMIRAYAERWERGRISGQKNMIGAVARIHERTRSPSVDPSGRGVPQSTIRSVLSEQRKLTELRIADALLTATEQPFALYDGTVEVVPNPRGDPVARARCCGGSAELMSLFGALRPDGSLS